MSLPNKFMVFLGRTFSGRHHDYSMLKQELRPDLDWFADIHVRVDLGYLGIQADYRGDQIDIPTKKPRKSQKNPTPELSAAQKAVNNEYGTTTERFLFMAFELSENTWKLGFTTGPGQKPRERAVTARDQGRLLQEIAQAKRRSLNFSQFVEG